MTDVVFLPGMGADERLFELIQTGPCRKHFIRWHSPLPDDTLVSYATQIKKKLEGLDRPILLGVSLGGMMAMELRELIDVRKTIIISSVKTIHEMPGYFAWLRTFRVNEWIPAAAMKHSASLMRPFLCGMSQEKPFELFKAMLQDADEAFIRWSLRQVMHWSRTDYSPGPIVHIHGSADITFPISNIRNCTYTIPGGTHDMILSKANEISIILNKELAAGSRQ